MSMSAIAYRDGGVVFPEVDPAFDAAKFAQQIATSAHALGLQGRGGELFIDVVAVNSEHVLPGAAHVVIGEATTRFYGLSLASRRKAVARKGSEI